MNNYQRSHDLESGQAQYALQDRSSMAAVLSKRRKIEQELSKITQTQQQLQPAQQTLLDSTTPHDDFAARTEIESLEYEITESFRTARSLAADAKQDADVSNPRIREQLQHIATIIRKHIEEYRRAQSDFAARLEAQIRRRYALVHVGATEQEITEGVQSVLLGNERIFQASITRSARASAARAAVMQRSVAIRKVAEDLQSLNELFEEVGMLVQMQDAPVEQIAKNADVTVENYKQSTRLLDRAILSARNARKYKWWILGVCVLILAIIAVIIYFAVKK